MGRVDGKVALVTGAASGIGAATAQVLASEGARVIAADIDAAKAAASVAAFNGAARAVALDVTDDTAWAQAVATAQADFGGFDILVNCAGILERGTIADTEMASWNRVIDVNVTGTWRGCHHAVGHMKEHGGGAIVNISSVAGMVGDSFLMAYCASKGAVRLLTKSIALYCIDQANGIRCNSVHPGVIETPMVQNMFDQQPDPQAERRLWEGFVPGGRFGEPEDVAKMILYLVSDDARFVNGAEFVIDGGGTAA
jgi:NAD(P)-dependent dehydrogenase (short-subunit alcohol dehydrogenase family)